MISTTQRKIIDEARRWIGVPFHHQGRSMAGCDCAGVVVACAKKLDMKFVDLKGYGRLPNSHKLEHLFKSQMIQIALNKIQPADAVLIAWRNDPHHVGIISDLPDGRLGIIHSYQKVGRVVEHGLDQKWRDRIVLAFRFPQTIPIEHFKTKDIA
ncbi:MAG: hypothetical protein DRP09_15275 [Candidatus Thorarchaeota archaeon]|nr:MAG: hypothetical protein DRP09_15275 [Candidatus Thorarchaeota archaeon]